MLRKGSKIMRILKVSHLLIALLTFYKSTDAARFDGCDHTFNVHPGITNLESPNYPRPYPPGTSCRYKLVAPLDHVIIANCTLNLDKVKNGCGTEYLYVARDGDKELRDAQQFCGSGTFTIKSDFNSMVVALISGGSSGSFKCELRYQPQPCDCGWSINTKIANGQETSVNEFPSVVALRDRTSNRDVYCSATIISHRHFLTAAHCTRFLPNPANIEALVGRHDISLKNDTKYADVYYISKIIEHPSYTEHPVNNDIAILVANRDIEYSRAVGPICLPPPLNASSDFLYKNVDVIGWGSTFFSGPTSDTLQKITLLVTDNPTCAKFHKNQDEIYPTHICTYDSMGASKDSCQYDSGGPVIYRGKRQFLVGIISFGKGCGVRYNIGVNTRITSYLDWIKRNTGISFCNVQM